jgi:Intraflagellar transport complex B, subunit 20
LSVKIFLQIIQIHVSILDIDKYQKIAEDLVTTSETLSVQVEEEKIAALQANIKLQHEAEHRAILQHQLQVRLNQPQRAPSF